MDQTQNGTGKPGSQGSLFPSLADQHLNRQKDLANNIEDTLLRIAGIEDAKVHMAMADRSLLSANPVASSEAMVIIIKKPNAKIGKTQIRKIVSAAVGGLQSNQVSVFISNSKSSAIETDYVGPIEVVSSSVNYTKIILGGLLTLCIFLSLGLIRSGIELRKLRQRLRS